MNLSEKFFSNQTLIFTIGGVIPAALNFIFIPIYAIFLSPEEFGLFSFVVSFQSIFLVISSLSLSSFLLRKYFDYDDTDSQKNLFGSIFIFLAFYNLIFVAALLIFFPYILENLNSSVSFRPYFILMISSLLFEFLFIFPLVIFRLKRMAINFVIFNFLRQLTTFLISIYLIASLDAGVTGRFIGMLLSNILF